MAYVYRININDPENPEWDGKFYIGARNVPGDPTLDTYYGSGKHLREYKSLHGTERLEVLVLATTTSIDELRRLESFYIEENFNNQDNLNIRKTSLSYSLEKPQEFRDRMSDVIKQRGGIKTSDGLFFTQTSEGREFNSERLKGSGILMDDGSHYMNTPEGKEANRQQLLRRYVCSLCGTEHASSHFLGHMRKHHPEELKSIQDNDSWHSYRKEHLLEN